MHTSIAVLVPVGTEAPILAERVKANAIEFMKEHQALFDYFMLLQDPYCYPSGVLFGKQNPDIILRTLRDCQNAQYLAAISHQKRIEADTEEGLSKLVAFMRDGINNILTGKSKSNAYTWELKEYLSLINGEFCAESSFYDIDANSALVNEEKVKKNPAEWALVMFDAHV